MIVSAIVISNVLSPLSINIIEGRYIVYVPVYNSFQFELLICDFHTKCPPIGIYLDREDGLLHMYCVFLSTCVYQDAIDLVVMVIMINSTVTQ